MCHHNRISKIAKERKLREIPKIANKSDQLNFPIVGFPGTKRCRRRKITVDRIRHPAFPRTVQQGQRKGSRDFGCNDDKRVKESCIPRMAL
jgi:hypothetical protein